MAELRLYNTKTRKVEPFVPIERDNVRMYVCGPTVYDRAHLGNARPVVVFDVLYRLLRHQYGADHVTYVRNFTDVDDKINARAAETGRSIGEITDETIQWFWDDMDALGALRPDETPRATAYIGQMIAMCETLIGRGHAYAAEGHVLFAVESYADYGRLSGRSIDDMIAGARVEVAPYKRNPMDFVLWKPSSAEQPGWDSPWGRGRPGWHIECSAMARDLLGESFDIHGGGNDLMFPHHENEIAQSRCAHPEGDFARVWMHNEMLQVDGKKMSKSLGNFFTVRELINEYDLNFAIENVGPAIRLRLLEGHYRAPLDAGRSFIEASANKLGGWWFEINQALPENHKTLAENYELVNTPFIRALQDDLNTPKAIAEIDAMVEKLRKSLPNRSILNESLPAQDEFALAARTAIEFLGFDFASLKEMHEWPDRLRQRRLEGRSELEHLISELIKERDKARAIKDWARADQIRDMFEEAGVEIRDADPKVKWRAKKTFDPSKLEALE